MVFSHTHSDRPNDTTPLDADAWLAAIVPLQESMARTYETAESIAASRAALDTGKTLTKVGGRLRSAMWAAPQTPAALAAKVRADMENAGVL